MANHTTIQSLTFNVGDLVKVHQRILEGDKERIQIFEGMVKGIRGRGENQTFTVRKMAIGNIGVERIFPANSPWISKIELKKKGHVRRAKLTYLSGQSNKQIAQINRE